MKTFTSHFAFVACLIPLLMREQVKSYDGMDEVSSQELLGNRHRILEKILEGYDCRLSPPGVDVELRLELLEFQVTDEMNKIKADFWFRQNWCDWRLRWNPENFGGVESVNVMDTDVQIWRPDISVINSIHAIPKFDPSNFRIYYNGTVEFLAQNTNVLISCYMPPLTLKTNPLAIQKCTMIVGSWGLPKERFSLTCNEPISYTSDDYRDIWDHRIIRTTTPTQRQQKYDRNIYNECLYTIVFRAKPDTTNTTVGANPYRNP